MKKIIFFYILSYFLSLTQLSQLYGFGDNLFGQLGVTNHPIIVTSLNMNILKISAGGFHSLVVTTNGNIYSFGNNNFGQLGLGDNTNRNIPTQISSLSGISQVSAGGSHSLVLANGALYSFGYNGYSQLGISGPNLNSPYFVDSGISQISAGYVHSIFLKNNGSCVSVFTFGSNNYGELGLPIGYIRRTPTVIPSICASQISAGNFFSLVLTTSGSLLSFGYNFYGQLGVGDLINRDTPTLISFSFGIISQISSGYYHSLVLTSTGVVYAFGNNQNGELGQGDYFQRTTPTVIPSSSPISQVSAGYLATNVLSTSGDVFCSGKNFVGNLIYKGNNSYSTLTINPYISNAVQVSTGQFSLISTSFLPSCFGLSVLDPNVCSSNGICGKIDSCLCTKPYLGNQCQYINCNGVASNDPTVCSGAGMCTLQGCICQKGSYLLNQFCNNCPPGTFQPFTNMTSLTSCILCLVGTFNPIFGSPQCTTCPSNATCLIGSKNYTSNNLMASADFSDPLTNQFNSNSDFATKLKFGLVLGIVIPLALMMSTILLLVYLLCGRCKGKRSISFCDIFFSERHELSQNEIRKHIETSSGAVFTNIAIVVIAGLIISTTVDFFLSNTFITQNLSLNPNSSPYFILKSFQSSANIYQGTSFCNQTRASVTNIVGNFSYSMRNNGSDCLVGFQCNNCQFVGLTQQICWKFNDPANNAFTSSIFYYLNLSSVIQDQTFSLFGNLVSNQIYYGNTPTVLDVNIYRSSFLSLNGGAFGPIIHLGDYFTNIKDNVFNGFFGTVSGISETTNSSFVSGLTGFSFCYQLNLQSESYIVKELSRQTTLNYLSQVGSLCLSVIGIIGFIFSKFEKLRNKIIVTKAKRKSTQINKEKELETTVEPGMMVSVEDDQNGIVPDKLIELEKKLNENEKIMIENEKKFEMKLKELEEKFENSKDK